MNNSIHKQQFALKASSAAELGKVAILMGGISAEREISKLSGSGVLNALRSKGIDAYAFDPAQKSLWTLKDENFQRCFVALHGRYGEDGCVQGALEILGIAYTGSSVMASSIAMDKLLTKRLWQAQSIPTPAWHIAHSALDIENAFYSIAKNNTLIVKPSREGSTLGLSKITSIEQCIKAYADASNMDKQVLCEEFIEGIEVTCTIIEDANQNIVAFPLIRIEAPDGNYDYQNKYFKNDTRYHIPSGLPANIEEQIKSLAIQSYKCIGCSGWARVDIMIDERTQSPYLLEINTAPGMTSHSLVPMAAKAFGIDYADLCLHLISTASTKISSYT